MLITSVVVIGSTSALAVAAPYLIALAGGTAVAGGVGGAGGIAGLIVYLKRKKKMSRDNSKINDELKRIDDTEEQNMESLIENTDNTQIELQENINDTIDQIKEGSEEIADKTEDLQDSVLKAQDAVFLLKKAVENADEHLKPTLQKVLISFEETQKINAQLQEINGDLNEEKDGLHKEVDQLKQTRLRLNQQLVENNEKIKSIIRKQHGNPPVNSDSARTINQLSNQLSLLFRKNQQLETENTRLSQIIATSSQNDNNPPVEAETSSSTGRFGLFGQH